MQLSWSVDDVVVETYLPGGYRNRNYRINYRGQRYVLRLVAHTGGDHAAEIARLAAVASVFPRENSSLQLSVPLLEAANPTTGALLTRWCDYPLLAQTTGISAESLGVYLAELHHVLARLPDAKRTALSSAAEGASHKLTAQVSPVRAAILSDLLVATDAAEELLAQLPLASQHQQLCHIDLNPWNLLVHNTHWVTLDWEVLGIADPLFDLVTLCDGYLREHGLLDQSVEFAEAALHSYNRASDSERNTTELSVARQEYRFREYAWAEAQIASGNHRSEVVAQRDDFAALLRDDGFDVVSREL